MWRLLDHKIALLLLTSCTAGTGTFRRRFDPTAAVLPVGAALANGRTPCDKQKNANHTNDKNMNNKFDELTKTLAQSVTRRAALKLTEKLAQSVSCRASAGVTSAAGSCVRGSRASAADADLVPLNDPQPASNGIRVKERQNFPEERDLVGPGLFFKAHHEKPRGSFWRIAANVGEVEVGGDERAALALANRHNLRVGSASQALAEDVGCVVPGLAQNRYKIRGQVLINFEPHAGAPANGRTSS